MIVMNRITKHLMIALLLAAGQVHAEEALRADVGKPLQAAQDLMKAGKYKDALARVREAEAAGNRTPNENYYRLTYSPRHTGILQCPTSSRICRSGRSST